MVSLNILFLNSKFNWTLTLDLKIVDSNDVLYNREPQFVADVDSMCTVLLDNILERLKTLADKPNSQVIF